MTVKIDTLIESLLNKNESILFDLLGNFEKEFLENIFETSKGLFDTLNNFEYNEDDLELKLFVLNNLGSQVLEKEKTREKFFKHNKLKVFFKLIYLLNKSYFQKSEFISQDNIYDKKLDSAFYTVSYAVLSDNTVEVNTVLKSFQFDEVKNNYNNDLDLLEGYIQYLFIKLSIRIQNSKDKKLIDEIISEIDQLIKDIIHLF